MSQNEISDIVLFFRVATGIMKWSSLNFPRFSPDVQVIEVIVLILKGATAIKFVTSIHL